MAKGQNNSVKKASGAKKIIVPSKNDYMPCPGVQTLGVTLLTPNLCIDFSAVLRIGGEVGVGGFQTITLSFYSNFIHIIRSGGGFVSSAKTGKTVSKLSVCVTICLLSWQ